MKQSRWGSTDGFSSSRLYISCFTGCGGTQSEPFKGIAAGVCVGDATAAMRVWHASYLHPDHENMGVSLRTCESVTMLEVVAGALVMCVDQSPHIHSCSVSNPRRKGGPFINLWVPLHSRSRHLDDKNVLNVYLLEPKIKTNSRTTYTQNERKTWLFIHQSSGSWLIQTSSA